MTTDDITLHRGLAGVYVDRSATTCNDVKEGSLEYRGYNIDEIAKSTTFEDTATRTWSTR